MPLASRSYTTFVVNFFLLMMHTASAPLSFHILYAMRLISGFPIVRVLWITASGSVSSTLSTISFPNVSSGFGAVHRIRAGTFLAKITARQGPIPEPVATRTTDLKSVAMRSTPHVGIPRTHRCAGARSIVRPVKSPARLTIREKPTALVC
ncbi:hypothetical protein M3J09_011428 [Ascochyta lentis]